MTKGFEKMNFEKMNSADEASFNNKERLLLSRDAVCFNCLSEFAVSEITEWVDNSELQPILEDPPKIWNRNRSSPCPEGVTAICPKCSLDSVLPKDEFTEMGCTLKELHYYWFSS